MAHAALLSHEMRETAGPRLAGVHRKLRLAAVRSSVAGFCNPALFDLSFDAEGIFGAECCPRNRDGCSRCIDVLLVAKSGVVARRTAVELRRAFPFGGYKPLPFRP